MWNLPVEDDPHGPRRTAGFTVFYSSVVVASVLNLAVFFGVCGAGPLSGATQTTALAWTDPVGIDVGTRVGQLAPDFVLPDARGRTLALGELRGHDVLIVFWNLSCPHCAAKIPLLNRETQNRATVVAVAVGATSEQLSRYTEDRAVKFTMLADTDARVARAYRVRSVPLPYWIGANGTIALSGPEYAPELWSYLSGQNVQSGPSLDLKAYVVPYIGDIDGSVDAEWFAFYDRLRRWHDANAMPGSASFYPETMNDPRFNQIVADMHLSENLEVILKGEDQYQGRRIDLMTYSEVRQALAAWQNKFVFELEKLGYSDVASPVAYNQLLQRFNDTIRDAARDLGFVIYFEQGTSDEYGYVDLLPDFDVTQYSVPLTTTGLPGPDTVFRQPEEIIQEILDFDDERLLFIEGIKVVPLLCHQQDFRIAEGSAEVDEEKFGVYTTLLTMAREDPRIVLLRPQEVYELRHMPRNSMLTDFETDDHGWLAAGVGQGRFEIGVPEAFDPEGGECLTECFGTGPSEDHSDPGVNAACTNLDGHMASFESSYTNSLTSPVYDFSGRTNVGLELWHFMEIEGMTFDSCYFQYKNDPVGDWVTFQAYSEDAEDADDWTAYAASLSSVADGRSYFQLRFYCTTDGWFEGSGLCLDDIRLSWSFAADFDGDNKVNFFDYAALTSAWMTVPGDPDYSETSDLSGDNVVNMADLLVFADEWLPDDNARRSVLKVADVSVQICDWQGCAAGAASISVDDSYPSCRDILNQNGFRGTYYLSWTDTFSQADWDLWKAIYAEGHEIGGHTTSHGAGDFLNEATLRWELSSNRDHILTNVGLPEEELTSFAWPRGDTSAEGRVIASEYYVSARGYHINRLEDKDPADFMNLKSLNTPHYHDPEDDPPDLFQKADEAESLGKWANYVFHNECLDDGLIAYLATRDLWVAPVGRVAKYIKERQNSRLIDIQRRASELSCTLVSNLDPVLFNQKLTISAAVDSVAVEAVLVNGRSTMFTDAVDHILFNVHPSGSDEIRIILR